MRPDEAFGSCADDIAPKAVTCATRGCENPPVPNYLMCWECRDRLNLKTQGTRPPKKEAPRVTASKPHPERKPIKRTQRHCSCGFTTDWPASWARHAAGSCNGHETKTPCAAAPSRAGQTFTARDTRTLRLNAHHGAAECARLLERTAEEITRLAATHNPPIDLTERDHTDNAYLQEQLGAVTVPPAPQRDTMVETTGTITTGTMAEDEHEKIMARIERYSTPPEELISVRDHRQNIALETIDVRLRLLCATVEASGSGVPASTRCCIEENVDRIRELIKGLAS